MYLQLIFLGRFQCCWQKKIVVVSHMIAKCIQGSDVCREFGSHD